MANNMCEAESGSAKASEIVKALQELIELHGDCYVYSMIDWGFLDEPEFEKAEENRSKRYPNDSIKPDRFVFM